jgi:hypothetical protein
VLPQQACASTSMHRDGNYDHHHDEHQGGDTVDAFCFALAEKRKFDFQPMSIARHGGRVSLREVAVGERRRRRIGSCRRGFLRGALPPSNDKIIVRGVYQDSNNCSRKNCCNGNRQKSPINHRSTPQRSGACRGTIRRFHILANEEKIGTKSRVGRLRLGPPRDIDVAPRPALR